jgi:hypothetical protein
MLHRNSGRRCYRRHRLDTLATFRRQRRKYIGAAAYGEAIVFLGNSWPRQRKAHQRPRRERHMDYGDFFRVASERVVQFLFHRGIEKIAMTGK